MSSTGSTRARFRRIGVLGGAVLSLLISSAWGFAGCGDSGGETGSTTGNDHPFCGDGVVQADLGEQCDDKNDANSDACLSTCQIARCGDSRIQSELEECDDANDVETDACLATCVRAECGDGWIQKDEEDCDDGNEEDGDACSHLCATGTGCGNGSVEAGEQCDDGNRQNEDDCTNACQNPACGDGYGQRGIEQCDDGDMIDDNACSNTCKVNAITTPGCPGTAISIDPGVHMTLGSLGTEGMAASSGSCGGAGPEVVYAFTPTDDGLLRIEVVPVDSKADVVLYARTACGNGDTELDCTDRTGSGGREFIEVPVELGKTAFVFADTLGADHVGPFFLVAEFTNLSEGDNCPGLRVPLDLNQTATLQGNTFAATADRIGQGTCSSPHTKDIVYEVVPKADGQIFAELTPQYDASLYIRRSCGDPTSQLQCAETSGPGGTEVLTQDVTAGLPYYFVVDGFTGDAGPFKIDFTLAPF